MQRHLIPKLIIPDSDCLISILIYSVRHDPTFSDSKRKLMEQELVDLKTQRRIHWQSVEWNAWDARVDAFDVAVLKLGEDVIDRRPTDEQFIWFRGTVPDLQKSEMNLERLLDLATGG